MTNQAKIKIGVAGCFGRMGQAITDLVLEADDMVLAGGTVSSMTPTPPDCFDAPISSDPRPLFEAADVVIDFTTPDMAAVHAELAARYNTAYVLGTTGLGETAQAAARSAAKSAPIVQAANMSLGVNLLMHLVKQAAACLDENFDIEIIEAHHHHKKDAPSGTALALGHAAAAGRGKELEELRLAPHDGIGDARQTGGIGFANIRGGDIIGEHTVMFAGMMERIELTHKAADRRIFAAGAIKAARWVAGRQPGLYSMGDVLGL